MKIRYRISNKKCNPCERGIAEDAKKPTRPAYCEHYLRAISGEYFFGFFCLISSENFTFLLNTLVSLIYMKKENFMEYTKFLIIRGILQLMDYDQESDTRPMQDSIDKYLKSAGSLSK